MKIKLISTCTDTDHEGYRQFIKSLDKFKWSYDIIFGNYQAYGSKMINAYEYALKTDCTHLFITDAYDVCMLGTMEEALDNIDDKESVLFNAEKGCWPYGDLANVYPRVDSRWKYLNGGCTFVEVQRFIKLFEENPIEHLDNDQANLTLTYLNRREEYNMKLDTDCSCFQSVAFEEEGEFDIVENRIFNLITGSIPVIIHGNGKTNMNEIYKLL